MKIKFLGIEIKKSEKNPPVKKPKYLRVIMDKCGYETDLLRIDTERLKIMLEYYGRNSLDIRIKGDGAQVDIQPGFDKFIFNLREDLKNAD